MAKLTVEIASLRIILSVPIISLNSFLLIFTSSFLFFNFFLFKFVFLILQFFFLYFFHFYFIVYKFLSFLFFSIILLILKIIIFLFTNRLVEIDFIKSFQRLELRILQIFYSCRFLRNITEVLFLIIFGVNVNFINIGFLGILTKMLILNLVLTFRRSIFVVRISFSVL